MGVPGSEPGEPLGERTAAMSPPTLDPPAYPASQAGTKGAAQANEAPSKCVMI